ncbi:arginine--tRNA ligase [Thiohalomonas denitrificans]|uniref:Arginine--tRNA ligase n=1 Tax=Thiohalomonas denitrificans TaxID=415747 RepID=A0A1G5QZL9_9GAMM|nr:arginine--tRNA ligase [Thiohalomonas denitrificans]SCZ67048.1 arginyl-tRNA synthetase [Thiohalomonas denitrificans]
MKHHLEDLVRTALERLRQDGELECAVPNFTIERTRDKKFGDFAANAAMLLAKPARRKPRDIAELIINRLPSSDQVANVEIAGPGFINFHMTPTAFQAVVGQVFEAGEAFGRSTIGNGKRVQVEFVSANPTGPLHVGHGRGAAYGATVADLLAAAGFEVHREYYVNDAGRQMDILGTSVWLRYLELCGEELVFPSNGYKGDYIWDIAASIHRDHGDAFRHPATAVFEGVAADEPAGGDKEAHIDGLVSKARTLLGEKNYQTIFDTALDAILGDIRRDLEEFGVAYEKWFSERSLVESGKVDAAIERLTNSGHLYEKEGALWFRSTDYGDEKDRVVVRDNGVKTYFASDIAYHMDKLERGFERVIDVWGADHHGYVPRVKAAMEAIGDDASLLDVLLVQFAILYRGGEKAQMSTRSGEFVTLRELREEVGNDAARFFYVSRKCEQHLDFDLDLAKSQSNDNPVYYIQYAHARICSVMHQLKEKGLFYDQQAGLRHLPMLKEDHEQAILQTVSRYPEVVEAAALVHEPHQLAHYLRELANDFHTYYNAHQFLVEESTLRDARLALILAAKQVLANGLSLLGVSAPESM